MSQWVYKIYYGEYDYKRVKEILAPCYEVRTVGYPTHAKDNRYVIMYKEKDRCSTN